MTTRSMRWRIRWAWALPELITPARGDPQRGGERVQRKAVGVLELNEAFASQSLACVRTLGLNPEMPCRNARFGVVSMCIGGRMGAAVAASARPRSPRVPRTPRYRPRTHG